MPFIVGLEGCYSSCNNLSLWPGPFGEGVVLYERQEDKHFRMEKAQACLNSVILFIADGERDGEV